MENRKRFSPQPTDKSGSDSATVQISGRLYERLTVACEKTGMTKSKLVRQMVAHCLDDMEV